MRGHEPLLKLRRAGYKPLHVRLWDCTNSIDAWWAPLPLQGPGAVSSVLGFPEIAVSANDSPELLDLRFLVGCTVLVDSPDAVRLRRLLLACEQAGAAAVYGFGPGREVLCTIGEAQTWRS
jgi:hypothetical protein